MNDYTPEGMLKRIEVLEEEHRQIRTVFALHQKTIDNILDYMEACKCNFKDLKEYCKVNDLTIEMINRTIAIYSNRIESLETTVGNLLKGNY